MATERDRICLGEKEMEGKIPKEMLGDNNILVKCKCGVFVIYERAFKGEHSLIPSELICTKCGEIIKVKDFINGN